MTAREGIQLLQKRVNDAVLGQEHVVDRFIVGLLADGHVLVEGLPGLAKTRTVKAIADNIDAVYSRIQFTPDLSPSDVLGEERLYEEEGKKVLRFHKGPIFGNIILADEINRAPAKVQSAMLEAMEEHQVTIAGQTIKLPKLFVVMATQNPIEQEGTYPLSEAQKDRFLMHVQINYVSMDAEYQMLKMLQEEYVTPHKPVSRLPQELIFAAQKEVANVTVSEVMGRYIVELVFATRYPLRYSKQLGVMIEVGISPRGSISLQKCAQAHAWMKGKKEVEIDDVLAMVHEVFRHRLIISEHARHNGRTVDDVVNIIIEQVPTPHDMESDAREAMIARAKR
jgi:MoxR-like ATPase